MTVYDLFGSSKKDDDSQEPRAEIFEGHDYLEFEKVRLDNNTPKNPSWRLCVLFFFLFVLSLMILSLHLGLLLVASCFYLLSWGRLPWASRALDRYALRSKVFFITSNISLVGVISPNIAIMLLMTCLMIFVKQSHEDPFLSVVLKWFNQKL